MFMSNITTLMVGGFVGNEEVTSIPFPDPGEDGVEGRKEVNVDTGWG